MRQLASAMGQKPLTPIPRRIPVGTESGMAMPSGSPGTLSRTATTLLYPVAHTNPSAAAPRAKSHRRVPNL